MNINKDSLTTSLNRLLAVAQRHALFLGIVGFGILYGYIIMQISTITTREPEQTKISEQLKAVPRPKVDKEVAKTIEGLESQNVNVQTIFNDARENPFSE